MYVCVYIYTHTHTHTHTHSRPTCSACFPNTLVGAVMKEKVNTYHPVVDVRLYCKALVS
jgi:hypothetical protein